MPFLGDPPGAAPLTVLGRLCTVIARVPRGRVITYGQVAEAAGFPGAARLTVRALWAGQGLPWHRVVAAGGRIALPGPEGEEQRLRLRLEGVTFRGGRVRMDVHGWVPRRRPPGSRRRATSARLRNRSGRYSTATSVVWRAKRRHSPSSYE